MNINDYIINLETVINSFSIVSSYHLTIDRKTSDIAFVSGKIEFRDNSALDFKEFIECIRGEIEKYKYAYNLRIGSKNLFRYDNAPDPRAKKIKTFPHHKHLQDGKIVESQSIDLIDVLKEIESIYISEIDSSA